MSTGTQINFGRPVTDGGGERPKPGTYPARLVAIVELGSNEFVFMGETKKGEKILLAWELVAEFDSAGNPFVVGESFTWSFSPSVDKKKKAINVRMVTEGLLGRKLSAGENFNIGEILGKPCLLGLAAETTPNGKEIVVVSSVAPPMRGMPIGPPAHQPFGFVIKAAAAEASSPDDTPEIPDWIPYHYGKPPADVIKESLEWKAITPF